jgi:hypothetical protein
VRARDGAGEVIPPIAVRSLERVGTQSRLRGIMVRWLLFPTGTCAKSRNREQSFLLAGLCQTDRTRALTNEVDFS